MNEDDVHEMLDGSMELRLVICVCHIRCSVRVRCVIPRFPNKEVKIINNLRLNEMKENINIFIIVYRSNLGFECKSYRGRCIIVSCALVNTVNVQ